MNRTEPLVLGIETSCDETGIGIVRGRTLLSNTIASSMDEHARYGGVVPEVAARAHLEALRPTLDAALADADVTLDELDAARDWLLLLGRKSAREKIASFLTILARREAVLRQSLPTGGTVVDLPLGREAMADYLGLTLETVSRQISALRREGVIALEGSRRVVIPDFHRLAAESGDDSDGGLPC